MPIILALNTQEEHSKKLLQTSGHPGCLHSELQGSHFYIPRL